jgi:hypothetical protein
MYVDDVIGVGMAGVIEENIHPSPCPNMFMYCHSYEATADNILALHLFDCSLVHRIMPLVCSA